MSLVKPIFVIGAGRSGSTEFHSILAEHPHVAWLSGVCRKDPENPARNRRVMEWIDYPVIGPVLKRRLFRGEFYDFWEFHCPGFTAPCRDLLASDVTHLKREEIRSAFSEIVTRKRHRLLIKITGWPRIGFLREIFPDAKFVHVMRDGRAVANSALNVDFWKGWAGPGHWGWGELTPQQQEEWERHGRSFVALAGIQWKILMEAVDRARALVGPESFREVRYERMCAEPLAVFREVCEFCELEWTPAFEAEVRSRELRDANSKWRKELTPDQQRILQDVLRSHLPAYGYAVEDAPATPPLKQAVAFNGSGREAPAAASRAE